MKWGGELDESAKFTGEVYKHSKMSFRTCRSGMCKGAGEKSYATAHDGLLYGVEDFSSPHNFIPTQFVEMTRFLMSENLFLNNPYTNRR